MPPSTTTINCILDNEVFFCAIYKPEPRHSLSRAFLNRIKPSGWGIAIETYLAAIRLLMNPNVTKTNLRTLYKERLSTLARETDSGRRNRSLTQVYKLAENKEPAFNLIRATDAKIYETMDALLQLLISNEGRWRHDRGPILQWDSRELAQQSDDLFEELAILFSQQSDAQLELLNLTWN